MFVSLTKSISFKVEKKKRQINNFQPKINSFLSKKDIDRNFKNKNIRKHPVLNIITYERRRINEKVIDF